MLTTDPLETAREYLAEVRAKAERIDQDSDALGEALEGLGRRELLAMRRPKAYGGPELADPEFRTFQEEVARSSGSLSFLQTQHQSSVSLLARSENETLKQEYLPKMGSGERLVGIGFSQLRRPGPPMVRAERVEGGYLIDGHVPWVTGETFYPEFLLGAALSDGRSLFAIAPLKNQPGVRLSEPMRLAAMESARTVTVDFERFLIPDARVASVAPEGWIQRNDMINVALQRHFALGCAQAALDLIEIQAKKKGNAAIQETFEALSRELEACREAVSPASEEELSTDIRLEARAWTIELASRCAQAAIAATGGSANSLENAAQRIYRETIVYTVSAQTPPIMEATLRRLVRPLPKI